MINTNAPRILLASNNAGKIREIQALLPDYEIIPQAEFVHTEVEESGLTFVENALLKARHAACYSKMPVIADDSGLAVDALNGEPGIYSARYAGTGANDKDNNAKLLLKLAGVPAEERTARFICVLVMLEHADDPVPIIAQGIWEGRILFHPQGANGFGYDPLFWVPDLDCSSAELAPEVKNSLSHRGKALRQLVFLLNEQRLSAKPHPA